MITYKVRGYIIVTLFRLYYVRDFDYNPHYNDHYSVLDCLILMQNNVVIMVFMHTCKQPCSTNYLYTVKVSPT